MSERAFAILLFAECMYILQLCFLQDAWYSYDIYHSVSRKMEAHSFVFVVYSG